MASDALFPHIQAKDQLGPCPAFSLGYPLMLAEKCQELVPVVGLNRLKPDGPMGGWRQLIEETKQGLRRLGRKRSDVIGRKSQYLGECKEPPAIMVYPLDRVLLFPSALAVNVEHLGKPEPLVLATQAPRPPHIAVAPMGEGVPVEGAPSLGRPHDPPRHEVREAPC